MDILERYLGFNFLKGYLLVLLVLLALFGFLDLIDELSEVGEGSYRMADAFLYVLSTFPNKLIEFSAVCVLMGGSFALAGLARGSELLAMRAAGMSVGQIAVALLKIVLMLAVGLGLVAQFVAPRSQQWGFLHRHQALTGSDALRTAQGFWSRDLHWFMNVRSIVHGRIPQDIDIYHFDADGRLLDFIHASHAEIEVGGKWFLQDVTLKRWREGMLKTEHQPQWSWQPFLTTEQLQSLKLPAETLSLSDLWGYMRYLRGSGQKSERYELLFWQRVLLPVGMAVMVPFLIPLILTNPRAQGLGWQVAFSLVVGVLYFLATQVVANTGLLLNIPPLLTALTPTAAILVLTGGVWAWCRP
ncbi:MAG: LPS export ABC transporter permease LptG [Methylothermaceae bacterium]|nr:LPS export ABC transporter permease LptG [Methylothermaceae bacterium]